MNNLSQPLTMALPKGRLLDSILSHLSERGLNINFGARKLSAVDSTGRLEVYKVKNHDLPTYIHHGITGLGIAGDDTIIESGLSLTRTATLPFGETRLCIAGHAGMITPERCGGRICVATSYVRMTREWFHRRGIPVKIIRLGGSVELALVLGLAPYIVDLVETGNTLATHGLEALVEIARIKVRLVANPAYFKLNYREIGKLADAITEKK